MAWTEQDINNLNQRIFSLEGSKKDLDDMLEASGGITGFREIVSTVRRMRQLIDGDSTIELAGFMMRIKRMETLLDASQSVLHNLEEMYNEQKREFAEARIRERRDRWINYVTLAVVGVLGVSQLISLFHLFRP